MDPFEHRGPPSLTPELWAKVFEHLDDGLGSAGFWRDISWDRLLLQRHQQQLHQLKLVCKEFHESFASHPGLVPALYLRPELSVRSLPSLLAWLQQHRSSVQRFWSECGSSFVEAVLGALVLLDSSLKSVGVGDISPCSLSSLAVFTKLETCSFWQHHSQDLDLEPLGGLPSLTHLVLQDGSFRELHNLTGSVGVL